MNENQVRFQLHICSHKPQCFLRGDIQISQKCHFFNNFSNCIFVFVVNFFHCGNPVELHIL